MKSKPMFGGKGGSKGGSKGGKGKSCCGSC